MKGAHSHYDIKLDIKCSRLCFLVVKDIVITFFFFFFSFSLSVLLFPDTHSVSVEISTEITR